MNEVLRLAKRIIRSLQTQRTEVPLLWKLILGVLLVSGFAPFWAALRLRTALLGPVCVPADFQQCSTPILFDCRLPDLIQTYLYLFGIWEPDVTDYVQRRLQPGGVFLDVGAHVGYFTLIAARCVGPDGRVAAVEAAPETHAALQRNLKLNNVQAGVRAINCAVAEREGVLDIYGGPEHNLGLTSTRRHRGMKFKQSVPAAPFHAVFTEDEIRQAQIIKIDVEGGEDAVLSGITSCLDRLSQDVELLIELSPRWWEDPAKTPRDVLEPFLLAGFNVYEIPNDYWPWRYLWPRCIQRPRRVRDMLDQRVARLDLVLSRRDVETL